MIRRKGVYGDGVRYTEERDGVISKGLLNLTKMLQHVESSSESRVSSISTVGGIWTHPRTTRTKDIQEIYDSRTAMTFTKVVFPLYCRPTRVSSISSFQKRDLNQSKIRLIRASMLSPVQPNPAPSRG